MQFLGLGFLPIAISARVGYAFGMNTYTEAERYAAETIAKSVQALARDCAAKYAPDDGDAAAGALCARVAEMLLGSDFIIMPRYVVEALRKQLEDVQ